MRNHLGTGICIIKTKINKNHMETPNFLYRREPYGRLL